MLIIVIIALIVLTLISSIKINFKALKENEDGKVIIKIKLLYGIIRFKKELSGFEVVKEDKKSDGHIDEELELKMNSDSWTENKRDTDYVSIRKKIEKGIEMVRKYKRVINYVVNRTKINILFWETELGFDDAALTGIITGIINIFKSSLFSMLRSIKIKPEKIHLKVIPSFKKKILKTDIEGIFTVKIGYIIIAGIKYLWITYIEK